MEILNGIININKPKDMTSHDVVNIVRKKLGIKRVGHTGTLDPMATGVLPICFGKATRIIEYLDYDIKSYNCEMALGILTDTLDITGEVLEKNSYSGVTKDMVIKAFGAFNGEIIQVPPKYSALKVDGRRLYDYARKGEDVEIKGRKTYIYSIEINNIDLTEGIINFDVSCSKGTYIRSICRDIGEILDCQGTMTKLTRTATGAFMICDALELDYFINSDIKELEEAIKPMDYPLDKLGKCVMEKEYAKRFINGQRIPLRNVLKIKNADKIDKYAIYIDQIKSDNFLGVAIYENDRFCYKAEKVVGEINENI